jgi:hypothetical protein
VFVLLAVLCTAGRHVPSSFRSVPSWLDLEAAVRSAAISPRPLRQCPPETEQILVHFIHVPFSGGRTFFRTIIGYTKGGAPKAKKEYNGCVSLRTRLPCHTILTCDVLSDPLLLSPHSPHPPYTHILSLFLSPPPPIRTHYARTNAHCASESM